MFSTITSAQLPENSFAADFTITDINNQEHNLYEILDDGKTVILYLTATWCPPCWTYFNNGILNELQNTYPEEVFCIMIDADTSTSEESIYGGGNSQGDWSSVVNFPIADDPTGQIAEDYALTYYPTIYKICPNRLATEIGQVGSVEEIYNSIQNCDQAQLPFDLGFLAYSGTENSCNGVLNPL